MSAAGHNIRMWLAHPDAENVDPNVDKAASRTQSRAGRQHLPFNAAHIEREQQHQATD